MPVSDPADALLCRPLWGDEIHDRLTAAGITIDHTTERITARPPTAAETDSLSIPAGVPVLAIQRTTVDTRGRTSKQPTIRTARADAVYTTTSGSTAQARPPSHERRARGHGWRSLASAPPVPNGRSGTRRGGSA